MDDEWLMAGWMDDGWVKDERVNRYTGRSDGWVIVWMWGRQWVYG
jgi:hypothetical protein